MTVSNFHFKSSASTGYTWSGTLLETFPSDFQEVQVIHNEEMGNTLVLDNHVMITQKDEHQYHELIVHPNCLQLNQHKQALVIGGGDGLCAEELLKYPFEYVTQVEIDEAVSIAARKYFSKELNGTFENPRFKAIYTDALKFFNNENIKYDYISLDLTDPDEDYTHSNPLYSGEFYNDCKNNLDAHGIMVVQIACPFLFTKHFQHNVNLLRNLFKHVVVYGMYMRCYGTYQYFAACSDKIELNKPNINLLNLNQKKFEIEDLKLYNTDMQLAMLVYNNELKSILK